MFLIDQACAFKNPVFGKADTPCIWHRRNRALLAMEKFSN
jgi:hypothetical protein